MVWHWQLVRIRIANAQHRSTCWHAAKAPCNERQCIVLKNSAQTPPTMEPKIGHTKICNFEAASQARQPAKCPNSLLFEKSSSQALKNEWWVGIYISWQSWLKAIFKKQKWTRVYNCSRIVYILYVCVWTYMGITKFKGCCVGYHTILCTQMIQVLSYCWRQRRSVGVS